MRKLRIILEEEDGTVLLTNSYTLSEDLSNMKKLEDTVIGVSNQLQIDVSKTLLASCQGEHIKKKTKM